MSYEYLEWFKYPTCVCLNLTDSCNLACRYCFVQQKPHFMTLETAKNSIDWLVKNQKQRVLTHPTARDEKISVTFFGGEPTLLWNEIIIPIVEYAEATYPNMFSFGMTTNGTLLDENRIKWLYDHDIHPLLSIDGARETQEYNRPCRNGGSSFDLVSKNIPIILDYFPETTFRATVYEPTVEHLFENYMFAVEQGFRNIFLCPNARDSWSEESLNVFHAELGKIITHRIMSYMMDYEPISYANIDQAFINILNHDKQVYFDDKWDLAPERNVVRCGLGTGSISIAYDGKLFGCQEQDSRDTNDYFYLGNIYYGIDVKRHKAILNDYNKPEKITCEEPSLCNNCINRLSCIHETCPSVSHDLYNSFFIRPKIDCLYSIWLEEYAIAMMDFLVKEEKNQAFKRYLDRILPKFKQEEED